MNNYRFNNTNYSSADGVNYPNLDARFEAIEGETNSFKADFTQLETTVESISSVSDTDKQLLLADMIENTIPDVVKNSNNKLSTVTYKRGETTIRTDVYTYTNNVLTLVTRTLGNGKYLTITFPTDGGLPYASEVMGV